MINIKNLTIDISNKSVHRVIKDLSIEIPKNQIFGLIGESGSGKTMTALSIMMLLKFKIPNAKLNGQILYRDLNLLKTPETTLQQIRGKEMSMIFQNPFTFFNPSFRIRKQFQEILEPLKSHRISEVLKAVQLRDEDRILSSFPHQLSGGQLQRLMIALSILHHPQILIADEPTTALDPTIKWEILNLLKNLKENYGLTLFIISHDIPYVSKICDQIAVIYKGLLMEISNAPELLKNPLHPYTQELLNKQDPNLFSKKHNPKYDIETGCPYTNRCPHVKSVCAEKLPPLFEPEQEHLVRCWLYDN